jgi:hypothetical protein
LLALGNACAANPQAHEDCDSAGLGGAAGSGSAGAGRDAPTLGPYEDGCVEISERIKEPLELKKRHVAPGTPDYCIDAPHTALGVVAPVTIEPGVVIEMTTGTAVEITEGGSLHAAGTAEAPVVFTGRVKSPGSWEAIRFETTSPDNVLDHVVIEHAGAEATFDLGSLILGSIVGRAGRLAITNTTIRSGAGAGIVAYSGRFTEFSQNTITEHENVPILGHLNTLDALDEDSSYSGNVRDWIEIMPVPVNVSAPDIDVSLARLDVPYRFTRAERLTARLEIAAGTTLLFSQDAGLVIAPEGSLVAVGTAEAPILFDSASGSPGSWKGVAISSLDSANRLEHVSLANGGSPDKLCCGYGSVKAQLIVGHNVDDAGRVTLRNVSITGSGGYGLYVFKNGTVNATDVTYANNALGNFGL